jgi:hypothetical protein
MFVMKVFHHDDPTNGRPSLWYKPRATRYSKLIDNHATSTWNAPPANMYHKIGYYRGAQDPPGAEPWIDLKGTIVSSDHEIKKRRTRAMAVAHVASSYPTSSSRRRLSDRGER